jgi:hypothetical protein
MKRKALFALGGAIVLSAAAYAAGPAVPHVFQAGQKATAAEVNANFQELANRIAAIPGTPVYDYRNYAAASDIKAKEFNTSGNGMCGNKELQEFTRTAVAGGTLLTVKRTRTSGGAVCQLNEFDFLSTPASFALTERRFYPDAGGAPVRVDAYGTPLPFRTSSMRAGALDANAAAITITGSINAADAGMQEFSAIGVEDVVAGGTTYIGCLKMRYAFVGGPNLYQETGVEWNCPNVGTVKTMSIVRSHVVTVNSTPSSVNQAFLYIKELTNIIR